MAEFNIDGLTFTDKLPHSRIERILYQILKKQSGGGGDDDTLVVDDPSDLGNGLAAKDNKIVIDAVTDMDSSSSKPITSGAVFKQLDMANTILTRI